MKKIYWRPRAVSRPALILIAVVSLVGLLLVENLQVTRRRPNYDQKVAAAELAAKAIETIYYERSEVGPDIDPSTDPTESGLIGVAMSPVTSISGDLIAKQTTINPNFAAVILDMLARAGVKEGDVVAVGCSGSFPALNICTYAALETLGAKPIVISSAAASQWGANVPELLWIDMERILNEHGVFETRSGAASIGGYEDRGLGLSEEGLQLVQQSIERNALPPMGGETFEESVEARMQWYRQSASGKPIKAYINVGGGTVSVGRSLGKKLFRPGLNQRPPGRLQRIDGVMARFISEDVPVIHLVQIAELAEKYGLPVPPLTMPEVGQSPVFVGTSYSNWRVISVLAVILFCLYGFIRSDIGFRLFRGPGRKKSTGHPEPMV